MQKLSSPEYLLYLMKLADYRKALGKKLKKNIPIYEEMLQTRVPKYRKALEKGTATSDVAKAKQRKKIADDKYPEHLSAGGKDLPPVHRQTYRDGVKNSDKLMYERISDLLKQGMTPGMRGAMPWMKKAPKTTASGRLVATPKKMDVHKYRPKSKELAPADESIPAFVRRKKRKPVA